MEHMIEHTEKTLLDSVIQCRNNVHNKMYVNNSENNKRIICQLFKTSLEKGTISLNEVSKNRLEIKWN